MARRKKSSVAEDLIQLVGFLPWLVGVILAIASGALLHHIALTPLAPPVVEPGKGPQLVVPIMSALWHGVAQIGQYVLPILFLAGAGLSAWKHRQSRELVQRATELEGGAGVHGMTWREFERLVAEAFRRRGYTAAETGGDGPDGGVDIVLAKGSEKFLAQCKHWRAQRVGVAVIRELYGVMAARGATGGFVVTSGRYTQDAVAFAEGRNIKLIDGPGLQMLLKSVRSGVVSKAPATAASEAQSNDAPGCPLCRSSMVKRAARRGASAGQAFWGCAKFPECRGTRSI